MARYKVGQKYGRITILEIYPYEKGMGGTRHGLVFCECSPEKKYIMNIYNLGTGHTQSCGCLSQEIAVSSNTTHGKAGTRIYRIYHSMIKRCSEESKDKFKYHSGRGIKVCERWLESFENFYEDMGEPPSDSHSIDRIDVNGDYEPSNCRWATPKEQSNNKTCNIVYEFNGESKTIAEWSDNRGIKYHLLYERLLSGWDFEKALTTPVIDCNKYYNYKGEIISHQKLARDFGIKESTLRARLKKGWDLEDALTLPLRYKHNSNKPY